MIEEKTHNTNKKKKQKRSWLERLKDESWEAELLVSAIAIFGTFQLFGVVNWITNTFINILNPSQYLIGYAIVLLGLFAISILASMFVIHFFLRAYWIGLVGLNSVFPDYSTKDSVYSEIYTKKMLATIPKLKDSIKKVDELCSVIFSAAFTFLLIYSYFGLFASAYLWLYNMLSSYLPYFALLIPLGLLFLSFVVQVVVGTISNIKSNHHKVGLQTWNFRMARFISMVTYGPIYKSVTQIIMIFGTNFKKKKSVVYLLLIFVLSGAFVALFQIDRTNIPYLISQTAYFDATKVYSGYYQIENTNNDFLLAPEIESDKIESSLLKVFIPILNNEERMRENICEDFVEDETNSRTVQRQNERNHLLECYRTYNHVYVNGEVKQTEFLKYIHPRTNQFGLIGYVELSNIKKGMNILEVKKVFSEEHSQEWSIPFYSISNNE